MSVIRYFLSFYAVVRLHYFFVLNCFSYEDAEFNVRAEGEDGKTASEYKQFDCLGTYDTLS